MWAGFWHHEEYHQHRQYCRLGQTEKSAITEHTLANVDHTIVQWNARFVHNGMKISLPIYTEVTEIHDNFNRREGSLAQNRVWFLTLYRTTWIQQRCAWSAPWSIRSQHRTWERHASTNWVIINHHYWKWSDSVTSSYMRMTAIGAAKTVCLVDTITTSDHSLTP